MKKETLKNKIIKYLGGCTKDEITAWKVQLKEKAEVNAMLEEQLVITETAYEQLKSVLLKKDNQVKIVTVSYDPKTDIDEKKAYQALLKRLGEDKTFKNSITMSVTTSSNNTPHYSLSVGLIHPQTFYSDTSCEIINNSST